MADVFDQYSMADAWDEMFDRPGEPRPAYRSLFATLQPLSVADLRSRADQLARVFTDRGVTFAYAGEERPFPLDLIPRILDAAEWDTLTRAVRQRVQALERFLADVYGPGEVLADGVVPRRLVLTSAHFHREAAGIEPANGVRVHVSGVDLIRDEEGRVPGPRGQPAHPVRGELRDREPAGADPDPAQPVRRGAGASRSTTTRPGCWRRCGPPRPTASTDPCVVVLTPGVYNAAYFEHALLARLMGVELVEGRDLVCSGNRVRMRTTQGERPVHVVYRRVDDEFLDPLHFRPDSFIGCPGIVNAARAGHVTLANAIGNGVADDKLLYTYVPDLIRYYLHEEPLISNVETHRLDDPEVLDHVLDHLDELVLKPVDGAGGKGIVIGPQADEPTLAALRDTVAADPRGWIAQRPVALSTSPTLIGDKLAPRHIDLRPFAVNDGDDVWLLPGGLTRVALPEGTLVVNSSQGGGSKDTWVLAREPAPCRGPRPSMLE